MERLQAVNYFRKKFHLYVWIGSDDATGYGYCNQECQKDSKQPK